MIKLEQFQWDGVDGIIDFGNRALLADEMGLGKTIQALAWLIETCSWPAVVVCPALLKYNWQKEAKEGFGLRSDVLEGMTPPKRNGHLIPHSRLIIVNYEILPAWWQYLRDEVNPQAIVFDEGHYIKNWESQRYTFSHRLAMRIRRRLILTGTPIANRPADLWALLSIIRPKLFPNLPDYMWTFTRPRKFRGKWQFKGAENLDKLHRILKGECMIRRRKTDVLDLPPKTRRVIEVPLSDPAEYRFAESNLIGWIKERYGAARAIRAAKVSSLVRFGYLLRLCARLKVGQIRAWIDSFLEASDSKLVIFTGNTPMIDFLMRRYHGQIVRIDGKVSGRKRQWAVEEFQKAPRKRLAACHFKAGGVGTTLHAAADVLFTDLPLTPDCIGQPEDRVHRIGQTRPCTIWYLVARGTIEARAAALLQEKFEDIEAAIDGRTKSIGSLDIFNDIVHQVMPHPRR